MWRRQLVALGLAVALPLSARAACPEPTTAVATAPEPVRPAIARAHTLAAGGACEQAATATSVAYDALAGQPRRYLEILHALYADTIQLQLAAHDTQQARHRGLAPTDPPPPAAVAPLCAADRLTLRHLARVRAIGRASPDFEATIAEVRGALRSRLAGATCPDSPPGEPQAADRGPPVASAPRADLFLPPGQLAAQTRERRPAPRPGRPWQAASRAGVALMAVGLMALGGGIAAGAADRVRHQGALQGGLLVAGTALFVGGFPLLIVGDQRARAAVAIGPGGAALAF